MIEIKISGTNFLASSWPPIPEKLTIIFIHGSGNSANFWKAQIEGLASMANTFAIDLAGHGKSDGEGMDTISAYADAIEAFVKEQNIPNPIPCGLSMGGAIALKLLLDGKTEFKAGILINTGAKLRVHPRIFDLVRNDYKAYTDSLVTTAASPKTDPLLLSDLVADAEKCRPEVVLKDFSACDSFDVMERLAEITIPILVLSAGDDRLSPPKYGTFLAHNLTGAELVHFDDAGHLSPIEKPTEVNTAIAQFVGRISGEYMN
jgi:pimeloyl-ACP methyl ester carboxylesterase